MKVLKWLDKHLEEMLLVILLAAIVLVMLYQIVRRYLFNSSLSWSEELGKFLFVWISWMGISLGQREGEHIKNHYAHGSAAFPLGPDRQHHFRYRRDYHLRRHLLLWRGTGGRSGQCAMLASRSAPPGATWRWCWAAD